MKWKCTFTLLLVIFLTFASIEFAFQPLKVQGEESSVDTPYVICKKTELMEIRYAPTGDLLEKSVSVRIEIYNNGSSPVSLKVIDRVASINSSTLTVLYGTPEPTKMLKNFGNLTKLIWENVTVDGGKTVRYRYTAESLRKIPIEVNTTLLVNGKPAYINESSGIYSVNANLSDVIGFRLRIKNVQQPLYTSYNRTAVQPLLCTTSLALSNDYFSGIKTSPKANSTTALAGKTVMTWITFLGNETQTLNASASVTDVGAWGAVTLDPITIQISSSSETLKSYFENMISSLNYTIELMEGFADSSSELSTQTSEMAQALGEIANVTSELGNTTALVQTLCLIGDMLKAANQTLWLAQTCLQLANISLTTFMSDNRTEEFLGNNSDLRVYLCNAVKNITSAYQIINTTRCGNETVLGLVQLAAMAYETAQAVNSTGTILSENVTDSLRKIEGGLSAIAISANQTKIGLEQSLSDLKSERTTLTDVLLTLNSKAILPFDPEIRHIETENCTLTSIPKEIDNKWSITAVNVTNPTNYSKIVYGVKLETNESLNPSVEVFVDGSWQTPKEMEWLGITHNSTSKTFYLWPRVRIEPKSTVNVLVDWLGRPLRIILNCEEKPEVTVDVDTADLQERVEIEAVEAQFSCSIVQPQLIMNFTAPPPPPVANVTQAKSLAEILMEYLQKPEVQIAVLLIIAVIAVVAGVSKKRKMEKTKRLSAEKGEIETLLKEIDEAKKILEEENPPD